MIVGILSDTHDRARDAGAGISILKAAGAEYFLHCGDVGEEGVIDLLAGVPAMLVWGNNDLDRERLGNYAMSLGINVANELGEIELGGKKFAITHGDNPRLVRQIIEAQSHDYLLLGHSHVAADFRRGRVRIINPGALYRAAVKSVATLDTASDLLTHLPLHPPG